MNIVRAQALLASVPMLGLITLASPALAKQAGTPAPQRAQPATIQEIVVTAPRRAQSLLSAPMSITASTGEQLERAGIQDLSQLQFTTPGYVPSYASGYTEIYIRGIGNNIFIGADPAVATLIDDVPRIYGSMVENFIDVERVEVLKGAQGGLYGRDAAGGVVNIITHQPSPDSFHGDARISYGEKNTIQASAYANMPLNDRMAFSLAFDREVHDPYVRNLTPPNPYTAAMFPSGSFLGSPAATAAFFNSGVKPPSGLGDQDFYAFNTKLLIKPTDNLQITFAGDYNHKADRNGNQIFAGEPGYVEGLAIGNFFGAIGIPVAFPPGFFVGHSGDFTAQRGIPVFTNLTDYGGSMTAVWSLPHVDLTSISAYRAQQTNFFEDLAASPVPLFDILVQNRKWYLYQEFRAVSNDTGRWHYLAGATYLSNNFHGGNHTDALPPLITNPENTAVDAVRNWSIYAQLGYDLTDQLNLTVSGRYVDERNSADVTTPTASSATMKESKFLPSATLSYKLDAGGNVYARWAKGFKPGGVNPLAPPAVFPDLDNGGIFRPEIVDTYEVGYRAPLFDRTVQVTLAGFYNNYRDLQVVASATPQHPEVTFAIVNAGSARTFGAEASVTWRVNQAVTLGANAGYLDARYVNFSINDPSGVLESFDASGERMPNSPRWQLAFSGDLDKPISGRFRLVGDVLVSHLSSFVFQQSALPGVLPEPTQEGYWLSNMRLGVRTIDDKYGLAIFANNLFNRGYITFGGSNGLGNQLMWGQPRIVGGEFTAKF
jgi:iron complex outermembrane receptor protein